MLCFLSIRNAMAMVNLDDWCQQTWPNNPRAFFDVLFHIRANDWLEIPMFSFKKVIQWYVPPKLKTLRVYSFFKPWIFSGAFEKPPCLGFFLADFFRGKLGANSQLWGQTWGQLPVFWWSSEAHLNKKFTVVSRQFSHIFTMYCACIRHCITTCSTYKNIQVNIWLPGSWHWSYLKKHRHSLLQKGVGSFGWILDFKSSVTTVCYPWLAVRLRMGMAFSPKKNYNLWLGCWIYFGGGGFKYFFKYFFEKKSPRKLGKIPILSNTFKGGRFADMGWGMEGAYEHHITNFMTWWLKLY